MTKHVIPVRVLLYLAVLVIVCAGWWQQARETSRLKGELATLQQQTSQFDMRITALSMALFESLGEQQPLGAPGTNTR